MKASFHSNLSPSLETVFSMSGDRSRSLFEKAKEVFPGGVNSPIRGAVKPWPFFAEKSEGAYIYTVDGARLADYVLAYGPLILGHRHPEVEKAIADQVSRGWLFASPSDVEVALAREILRHVKPGGMVRFVNSGTEATMTAVRLARGVTGRDLIVKFDGCYHGSHDYVLVSAGSAATHFGVPTSSGIPASVSRLTLVARFNDVSGLEQLFENYGNDIAAVIVEPVIANSGVIPPKREFLTALRRLTSSYGSLLIFDEVVTGFRLGLGGAQEYYGVYGDIVVLGKIIGGGLPIGAVVSSREIMSNLTPSGRVFNAGTFNAHPLSMAAGLATLRVLEREPVYRIAREAAKSIEDNLREVLDSIGTSYAVSRVESILQFYVGVDVVEEASHARRANHKLYGLIHEKLLAKGVFITPSNMEAIFTGLPHEGEVLDNTVEAFRSTIREVMRH